MSSLRLWVICLSCSLAGGNWLLQCSSCLDQALYSDSKIKENVEDADLQTLMQQIKHIRIREFDHGEDEFFNKFFSRRQLGIMAHELKPVMPTAVGVLPERRWTNPKGVTNQTKNVMLVRDTHLLFAALGALQLLAKKADVWDEGIEQLFKDNTAIVTEQDDNRRKREELLEQLVRVVAKVEVIQFGFAKTEESVARVEGAMTHYKQVQQERYDQMLASADMLKNKSIEQDLSIAAFQEDFRAAVDREARADLTEKRKQTEAELEVQLVKRSIEKLRWEEEQKTITLRGEEERKKDEYSTQKHHERVAFETAQKKAADLELLSQQEESNLRQQQQKHKDEKELLELRLKSDERRAEIGLQEAVERAKIEEEGKIKAARENEDVNTRMMQAEQAEKRAQMLAAIQSSCAEMLASARFGQWTPISSPMVGVQRRMQPCCRSTQIAMNWNQRAVPMVALAIVIPLKPKSFGNFRQVGLCCVSAEAEVKELEPEELVRQVVTGLSKACKSVEGKISGIRRQIRDPSEAELWRNRGNGLLQVTEAWYPGMTEVKVPDYSNLGDDGLPLCVEVELDPKKDFKQNAKLCFKQASKITKAIEKCAPLLKAQEEELKVWKATLAKVEGPQRDFDAEQVKQLYEELCAQRFIRRPKPKVPSEQVQQPEENKWRRKYGKDVDRFLSPNGLEVLAGRSASANERVSFELTLKDALWFHTANGIPGSHVTIRAAASEVTDEDLEFAAALAAWHSKARNKMWVPVMYCKGHQLRKPARRRIGQVQVSGNYCQLDVRPTLPTDS